VGFGVLIALAWQRSARAMFISVAIVALLAATAWIGEAQVVLKQETYAHQGVPLAYRDRIWAMGIEAFKRFPVAGVGIDNYNLISYDLVREWRASRGLAYDQPQHARFGHGHSLYINTLAERGVLGSLPLAALLLAWLVALWRGRPPPEAAAQAWLLWGGSASAFMVTAGIGLANTTLHHEHGILATLLLGLWLSQLRKR
ncbi:MAG TPA: O-antigen ligase family protein, partial [Gammaproteobacteria bacterium]|nr:O-antigen ligase family protein [Gammaproteobacteria bacterium]